MAIPTDIRPASFRGVPFEAVDAGYSTGRRTVVHEYPQRDAPFVEDNGRSARRWRLQAFLIGTDARSKKRDLIKACETYGPGLLMHPTEGQLRVQCESLEVSESSDGVNVVEVSLTFVEAGTTFQPVTAASKVTTIGDEVRSAVRDFYAARLQVRSVARKVNRLLTADAESRITAVLEIGSKMSGADVSTFIYAVETLADTYETGIDDGTEFATAWQDVFDTVDSTEDVRLLMNPMGNTFEVSAAAYPGTGTDADALIIANRYYTDLLLYASALARAAEVASTDTYAAYDDAVEVSTDLGDRLADLEAHVDGVTHAALVDLRRTMTEAILDTAIDLPRLRTLNITNPSLALTLAHDLYGDSTRATEILERNGLPDPNAVAGSLLVLTE